jgi:uncharacterized membrane protein YdbT with pleckstrin-like domain
VSDVAFPQRLLGDGEEVVLDLRPHPKRLVRPAAIVVAASGVASYLVFVVPVGVARTPLRWAIAVVAAAVVVRWSIRPWLRWMTTHYVLTTQRLVVRQGVFTRTGRDLPLARVNDVSFRHSLVGRILGCGTLTVESAGEHGRVVLDDVPSVELVQREIYRRTVTQR